MNTARADQMPTVANAAALNSFRREGHQLRFDIVIRRGVAGVGDDNADENMTLGNETSSLVGAFVVAQSLHPPVSDPARPQRHWLTCRIVLSPLPQRDHRFGPIDFPVAITFEDAWPSRVDPTSVSQTKASFIRHETSFGNLCRQPGPTPAGESNPLDHREVVLVETVKACWLRECPPQFRDAIEFVAIDSVKIANDALTKVRHRVPWDLRYRRDRRADPEWANRRRLMRARERLSDKSFAKMCMPSCPRTTPARSCRRGSPKKNCSPWPPPSTPGGPK